MKTALAAFLDFIHATGPHYFFACRFTENPAGATPIFSVIYTVMLYRYRNGTAPVFFNVAASRLSPALFKFPAIHPVVTHYVNYTYVRYIKRIARETPVLQELYDGKITGSK
nr:hypothetical protein [Candidatus Electrothrix aestuarii]